MNFEHICLIGNSTWVLRSVFKYGLKLLSILESCSHFVKIAYSQSLTIFNLNNEQRRHLEAFAVPFSTERLSSIYMGKSRSKRWVFHMWWLVWSVESFMLQHWIFYPPSWMEFKFRESCQNIRYFYFHQVTFIGDRIETVKTSGI